MIILLRIYKKIRSLCTIAKYKLIYGDKFSCSWNVNIAPSVRIRISKAMEGGRVIIGDRCSFREHVILNATSGKISIGEDCFFNDFVCINARSEIEIGSKTILGQAVKLYDHDHDFQSGNLRDLFICDSIIIGDNVWIGSNVSVLKGTTIGNYCVIGANSLIKKRIEDYTLYYNKIVPHCERIIIQNEIT